MEFEIQQFSPGTFDGKIPKQKMRADFYSNYYYLHFRDSKLLYELSKYYFTKCGISDMDVFWLSRFPDKNDMIILKAINDCFDYSRKLNILRKIVGWTQKSKNEKYSDALEIVWDVKCMRIVNSILSSEILQNKIKFLDMILRKSPHDKTFHKQIFNSLMTSSPELLKYFGYKCGMSDKKIQSKIENSGLNRDVKINIQKILGFGFAPNKDKYTKKQEIAHETCRRLTKQ